jgi:Reverse transcriptase (RNA-dependent DNA polymerase)
MEQDLKRALRPITRAELTASIEVGGRRAAISELPDPLAWKDLAFAVDAAAAAITRRVDDDRSPARAQLFPWPKDSGGFRPMTWLDPLDQAAYHAIVGRFIEPIERRIDRVRVLSARPERARRSWTLEPFSPAIHERRERAQALIDSQPRGALGLFDIRDYYPSVTISLLAVVLSALPIPDISVRYLLRWLQHLHDYSGVHGLPIGPDASSVIGNVLLSSADECIAARHKEFMRYMDDTWVFLEDPRSFVSLRATYDAHCGNLGLKLNEEKTRAVTGSDRYSVVSSAAIEYASDALRSHDEFGREAAIALFEYAVEAPVERKAELRRALTELTKHADLGPVRALEENPSLLRPAVGQWTSYLCELLQRRATRRKIDHDWIVQKATRVVGQEHAHEALTFLRVACHRNCDLNKKRGRALFSVAARRDGWQAPMRVLAAFAWGQSKAWREYTAIEMVEQMGDFSTRRAFAATLKAQASERRKPLLAEKVRLADPDLKPTADWLRLAA